MQIIVKFQVKDMVKALKRLRQEIDAPQKMLGHIGESLLNVNRARHRQNVAPDGSPWKPLSPLTLGTAIWKKQKESFRKKRSMSMATAEKIKKRKGTRMLFDRGDMMRDFSYQVHGSTVKIGFENKLAAYHHFGTGTYGQKGAPYIIKPVHKKALAFAGIVTKRVTHPGIPARPLVGFPDADKDLTERIIQNHLTKILKQRK